MPLSSLPLPINRSPPLPSPPPLAIQRSGRRLLAGALATQGERLARIRRRSVSACLPPGSIPSPSDLAALLRCWPTHRANPYEFRHPPATSRPGSGADPARPQRQRKCKPSATHKPCWRRHNRKRQRCCRPPRDARSPPNGAATREQGYRDGLAQLHAQTLATEQRARQRLENSKTSWCDWCWPASANCCRACRQRLPVDAAREALRALRGASALKISVHPAALAQLTAEIDGWRAAWLTPVEIHAEADDSLNPVRCAGRINLRHRARHPRGPADGAGSRVTAACKQ